MDQSDRVDDVRAGRTSFWQMLGIILIALLALFFVFGIPALLYFLAGSDDVSALEKFRDIAIVYIGILWILIIALLGILTLVMVWVAFQIKNRALPLLEDILATVKDTSAETTETVRRARGTVEFVSERVATPIITALSTAARWRATARMFVAGKDKRSQ